MKVRLLALFVLFVFVFGILVSCVSRDDGTEDTTTLLPEESVPDSETKEEPVFLDARYDGYVFTILQTGSWNYDEFSAVEFMGDVINDSKYERNMRVEDLYDIKINAVVDTGASGNGLNYIQKDVASGSGEYDISITGGYETCQMAYYGLLYNLQELEYIDLERSWWDDLCTADLSVAGSTYFAVGDYSTNAFDCSYCILFNKYLIRDYGFEDPYELVRSKKWTYDKFEEMVRMVYVDLDGDSKASRDDQYGLIVWQDSVFGMLNAAGSVVGSVNADGELTLQIEGEKNLNLLTKYITLCAGETVININRDTSLDATFMFANAQGLFYTRYLASVRHLREYDVNFGILPYPLWELNQDRYHTSVHSYGISMLGIPISVKDADRSSAVAEAIAYYSQDTVRVAYYDINLEGKFFTDHESAEMLDIILETRIYDAGRFYQVGNYYSSLLSMFNAGNTSLTSYFTKSRRMAEDGIKKINEAYEDLISRN
ncbi:MAG: hypothetical protein ACOX31_02940 [Eubacteriales bacterium]|jgi:hypothetical protein